MLTWRRAQKLLSTDLRSDIRAEYPLEDAPRAVQEYVSQMTSGKLILRPNE
jgi:NADPH:quinone reductase-like Zn-dependent oxidoreductase